MMNTKEKQSVLELAKIAVTFRNHDAIEFGPNEYWDKKLIEAIAMVGVKAILSNDKEEMQIIKINRGRV